MKNRILTVVLLVVLAVSALFVVACTPDEYPQNTWPIDISNFWQGNEDEETYTVTKPADGKVTISYEKSGEWQYAKRSLATEEAEQLKQVKTLVLQGTMTTDTNDPVVLIKIEYNEGIAAKEVSFEMSAEDATYEWDLSEAQLDKATRLLIFAEGARKQANGSIVISKFVLTNEAINPDNDVTKQKEQPVVEKEATTITADAKVITTGWYDSGDNVYTIEKQNEGYKLAYDKKSFSWAHAYALVKGDALGQMKSFKLTVKGTAGKSVLVKPFDKVEKNFVLTGGEDVVIVDLANVADVDFTQEQKVIVFAEPGSMDVNGELTIVKAEFSTEAVAPAPQKEVSEITSENKLASTMWYDSGDNVYAIEKQPNGYKLAYDKKGFAWAHAYVLVKGEALADMKTVKVTLKGAAGVAVLVKPFDKVEERVVLTGEDDVVTVDISKLEGVDFTQEQKIIIFAEPGTENVQGEVQILGVEFSTEGKEPAPADEEIVWESGARLDVNKLWRDGGDNKWTVNTENGVVLSYPENVGWASVVAKIDLKDAKFNRLVMTVKGAADANAIFKVESEQGNIEQKFENENTLSGEEQTFSLDLPDISGKVTIRIFGNFVDGAPAGTLEIKQAVMYNVTTIENLNKSFVCNNNARFTINENVISYTTSGWDTLVAYIDLGEGGKMLDFVVKGQANHKAIIKVGNVEEKFEANSVNGVLNGEQQSVTVNASELTGLVEVLIFLDWDSWADMSVPGEFTIVSIAFAK